MLTLLLCAPVLGAAETLTVYTVNYPLKYFAERIASEHAIVVFPVPGDIDPAFWRPDAATIIQYQKADLILLNGAGYAKWVTKASLPYSRLVNTSTEFANDLIAAEHTETHSHGPTGKHLHAGTASTTWLDFTQAAQQAGAIRDAFIRARPQLRAEFNKNFLKLKADLLGMDQTVVDIVSRQPDKPMITSHPVYQYMARRYGLNLSSVLWESDEIPSEQQWSELKLRLKNHPAVWMIWEGTPNSVSSERLAELGIGSLIYDPCANRPTNGDFMSVMRRNVDVLKRAFQ